MLNLLLSFFTFFISLPIILTNNTMEIVELSINGIESTDNLFIDPLKPPKVSWKFQYSSSKNYIRNLHQKFYEIIIYDETGQIFYDGGKVQSNRSNNIYLWDVKLEFSSVYELKACGWLDNGNGSSLSYVESDKLKFYSTLDMDLWNSSVWLSGKNLFRAEFSISEEIEVRKAFLYVSGIGYSKAYVNGEHVSDRVLDPAWTNYNISVLYSAFDIQKFVINGKNAIGVEVGDGWYATTSENKFYGLNALKSVRCVIQIFFKDEKEPLMFFSNVKDWKTDQGPITMDSIYNGESYDARMEQLGWNKPNFANHTNWYIPFVNRGSPIGELKLQKRPPVKDQEIFLPRKVTNPKAGLFVVDFGQNFAGLCHIFFYKVCERGTKIVLKHAELLNPDGTLYTKNLLTAKATDEYICKGDKFSEEKYRPTFTYHGFRYVSIEGLETMKDFMIIGIHFRSNVLEKGKIEFLEPKNHWWNTLQRSIYYGQSSNLMGIPTDCPQRDERLGWLADIMLSSEEASFNFDMDSFYSNYIEVSFIDVFKDIGKDLPDVVPLFTQHMLDLYPGDPTWTSSFYVMTSNLFYQYGDIEFVKNMYPYLKEYVSFLDSKLRKIKLKNFWNTKYGDWCPPEPRKNTIKNYTAAFYWIKALKQMKEFAQFLDKGEDVKYYETMELTYRKNFIDSFYDKENAMMMDNSQSAIILALDLEIFEELGKEIEEYFKKILVEDIVTKNRYHLTCGIIGTNFIFRTLTKYGMSDLAYAIALRITYPSYGYMFLNDIEPATTLWELWWAPWGDYYMDSRNHIMLGSIDTWIYEDVVGISNYRDSEGFDNIRIHPKPTNITFIVHTKATYNSAKGKIEVEIQISNPEFCSILDEKDEFYKTCPDSNISKLEFASFGRPMGRCGSFKIDSECHAPDSVSVLEKLCLKKEECSFKLSKDLFKPFSCNVNESLQLFVSGRCLDDTMKTTMTIHIPINTFGYICIPLTPNGIRNYSNIEVYESGILVWKDNLPVKKVEGILDEWKDLECVNFKIGSGFYKFEAYLN